jgi:3-oxoadipate enol-lactonase
MSQWIDYGDISLRYELRGSGARSLILLHEMAGSLETWDLLTPLVEADFRILLYDQRGSGLSEKTHADFGMDDHVRDIERLVETARLPPPYVVSGVASGAAIAVALAGRLGEKIAGLVLCAPALQISPDQRQFLADRSRKAVESGMRGIVDASLGRSFPRELAAGEDIYDAYRGRFLSNDPQCYARANLALAEIELEESLTRLTCPMALLAGRHDPVRPPELIGPLAKRVPHAAYEVVEGGHIMPLQAPQPIARHLKAMIGALR